MRSILNSVAMSLDGYIAGPRGESDWIANDDLSSQRFYHGTKATLKPGDLIEPGYNSNFGKRKKAVYVYLTATLPSGVSAAPSRSGGPHSRVSPT